MDILWIFAVAGCIAIIGCDPHRERGLKGRASDEWTRTYALAAGGELQIIGGTGAIEVSAADTPTTAVRAERIVHATTDAAARGLLPGVRIREDAAADHVLLQDQGFAASLIGVEAEVRFHVTTPASTRLRLRMLNGDIKVSAVTGGVTASTSNGRIDGTGLAGTVDARSTNGAVVLDIARVDDHIVADGENGTVDIMLPADANADIQAQTTNGQVRTAGLTLQFDEERTDRRVRGRLNRGGVSVAITAVNGDIRIGPRQ